MMKSLIKLTVIVLLTSFILFLSCKRELSCETCKEGNQPPIAVAGADVVITLPTDSVLLDGSKSSDPEGTISAWQWTKIAGPASFNIAQPSAATTVVKTWYMGPASLS